MIIFLKIILLFFLPANIILLLLLKFRYRKQIEDFLLLILSYGVGPIINGLLFHYLISFIPNQSNKVYLTIIFALWMIALLFSIKEINQIKKIHINLFIRTKKRIKFSGKRLLLFLPVLIMMFILGIQALVYPVVGNDSALYLNQSEAIYENKNLKWQKESTVIIRGDDEYRYNSAISPGIPSLIALNYLIKKENSYFVFKLLSFYYYLLLFSIFLLIAYTLSKKIKVNSFNALFFASLFFAFSWILDRSVVFNSKESIIYFFALTSIFLLYKIIDHKGRNLSLEILLGILLGLNMFINLHGIIIGSIILLILVVYSRLSFWERIKQVLYIFVVSLFLGAFEFIFSFKFIFLSTLHKSSLTLSAISSKTLSKVQNLDLTHQRLYQMKSLKDLYLKGKLQILTNIGVFGFYFWMFLVVIACKFKKVVNSQLGKIILSFIFLYFLIVLDPFNLNKHSQAIVLWGSVKYATLILLTSLIITSSYAEEMIMKIFILLKKWEKMALFITTMLASGLLLFKQFFISIGLKILASVIPVYKDVSFYQGKIENFFFAGILFLLLILFSLLLVYFKKSEIAFRVLVFSLILSFVFIPFFITDVGKVKLHETFFYLNKNREYKLVKTLNYGNIYNVYYYAKSKLPEKTQIKTNFNELYPYDDYFSLHKMKKGGIKYEISRKCQPSSEVLYFSNNIYLCKLTDN